MHKDPIDPVYDKLNIPENARIRFQTGVKDEIYCRGYFVELTSKGKLEQAEKDLKLWLTKSKQIDENGKWIGDYL